MIVLIGKSGSGKTTIEAELAKCGYKKAISYTTRPIRDNEMDGIHYHFISQYQFIKLEKQGYFAEYAQYGNNYYAVAKCDCTDDKVLIVERSGFEQLKLNKVKMTSFYIDVNVETRYYRMINDNRGVTLSEILARIEDDGILFKGAENEVDFVVENYDLQKCVREILFYVKEKQKDNSIRRLI